MKLINGSAMILVALTLGACGGGGELAACGSGNSQVDAILDQGSCGSAATVGAPSLTLALTDAAGAAATSVSPDRSASVTATLKNSKGLALPSVAVTFTTTDATGSFVPTSGTALTDASGVASVGLPAGTQAGAFTLTANAAVGSTSATATTAYSVTFPTLSLSALGMTPATLSAGGNAGISVTVSSGAAPYTVPLSVAFSSPCVASGKASIGSPVLTQNGVATASYTDKGCGVADPITATVVLGGASVSKTGTLTVLPTPPTSRSRARAASVARSSRRCASRCSIRPAARSRASWLTSCSPTPAPPPPWAASRSIRPRPHRRPTAR